jgi:hypothetical protein
MAWNLSSLFGVSAGNGYVMTGATASASSSSSSLGLNNWQASESKLNINDNKQALLHSQSGISAFEHPGVAASSSSSRPPSDSSNNQAQATAKSEQKATAEKIADYNKFKDPIDQQSMLLDDLLDDIDSRNKRFCGKAMPNNELRETVKLLQIMNDDIRFQLQKQADHIGDAKNEISNLRQQLQQKTDTIKVYETDFRNRWGNPAAELDERLVRFRELSTAIGQPSPDTSFLNGLNLEQQIIKLDEAIRSVDFQLKGLNVPPLNNAAAASVPALASSSNNSAATSKQKRDSSADGCGCNSKRQCGNYKSGEPSCKCAGNNKKSIKRKCSSSCKCDPKMCQNPLGHDKRSKRSHSDSDDSDDEKDVAKSRKSKKPKMQVVTF